RSYRCILERGMGCQRLEKRSSNPAILPWRLLGWGRPSGKTGHLTGRRPSGRKRADSGFRKPEGPTPAGAGESGPEPGPRRSERPKPGAVSCSRGALAGGVGGPIEGAAGQVRGAEVAVVARGHADHVAEPVVGV